MGQQDDNTTDISNPPPHIMAALADFSRGQYWVPQVTWDIDFKGQVTNGRLGRPRITMAPVSWLPEKTGKKVMELIAVSGL